MVSDRSLLRLRLEEEGGTSFFIGVDEVDGAMVEGTTGGGIPSFTSSSPQLLDADDACPEWGLERDEEEEEATADVSA